MSVSPGNPAHKHPFDQWIYLIGDTKNFANLSADIEMTLGDKILKISYLFHIFVPDNVMHCPLNTKRVGKLLISVDARITEEASVYPGKTAKIKSSKYIAKADCFWSAKLRFWPLELSSPQYPGVPDCSNGTDSTPAECINLVEIADTKVESI